MKYNTTTGIYYSKTFLMFVEEKLREYIRYYYKLKEIEK